MEVIFGRLREKKIGQIPRDTIATVQGLADDGASVIVEVTAIIAEKNKVIKAAFSVDILEPQKGDSEPKPGEASKTVKEKKFGFLSEPGGTTLEVISVCLQCNTT